MHMDINFIQFIVETLNMLFCVNFIVCVLCHSPVDSIIVGTNKHVYKEIFVLVKVHCGFLKVTQ